MGKALKLPKTECCVSKSRCARCPIAMLKEGTLPSGYTVKKRKLVKVCDSGKLKKAQKKVLKDDLKKALKKAGKKTAA